MFTQQSVNGLLPMPVGGLLFTRQAVYALHQVPVGADDDGSVDSPEVAG